MDGAIQDTLTVGRPTLGSAVWSDRNLLIDALVGPMWGSLEPSDSDLPVKQPDDSQGVSHPAVIVMDLLTDLVHKSSENC